MDSAAVFRVLSYLVSQPGIRIPHEARPIVFELLPEKTECWSFHPQRPQGLVLPVNVVDAPLRVRCELMLLWRLLADDDFQLQPEDPFEFEGDLRLLLHLATALRPAAVGLYGEQG